MVISTKGGTLVIGTATKDAEFKLVGEKQSAMCTFSLAAGKREDTTTIFVNCKAWRKVAEVASAIRKGDPVFVAGTISEWTNNNGVVFKTLDAEYVDRISTGSGAAQSSSKATQAQPPAQPAAADGFTPVDDDELPF